MPGLPLEEARRLFGDHLLAPECLTPLLGGPGTGAVEPLPFSRADAEAARAGGCLLVFRPDVLPDGQPLTLLALVERCTAGTHPLLRFASDDPWFARHPFARDETPERGWALAAREPWPETLNRTYAEADRILARPPDGARWRRRRAVEIAFDCLAFAAARGVRLLERRWDWSSTPAADGGIVNVGGFGPGGLEVLSYSSAVKHGGLGVCPTRAGHD